MSVFRRVGSISAHSTLRAYISPANLMWLVAIPIILSFVISLWMGGESGAQWADGTFVFETPRGDRASAEFPRVRGVFGIYLVFAFAALITRAGAIHEERRIGTLQRTLVAGVPHWEVIAAHVVGLVLLSLLQTVIFMTVTGLFGTPWLATGWSSVALPVLGTIVAGAGIAIGIAGFVHSDDLLRVIGGSGPSLLALLGGAFFPLDVAPAGVQRLAVINPVYWAVEALTGGYVYQGFVSQATPLAVLLLIGVLGVVIGVQGLRRFEW